MKSESAAWWRYLSDYAKNNLKGNPLPLIRLGLILAGVSVAIYVVAQQLAPTPATTDQGSTQLLKGVNKSDLTEAEGTAFDTHGYWYLDTEEFYDVNNLGWGLYPLGVANAYKTTVELNDSPRYILWHRHPAWATVQLDFRDYVRFKPDGGPGPNIFVTLGLVDWHGYGSTVRLQVPGMSVEDYNPFSIGSDLLVPTGSADMDDVIDWDLFPDWQHTRH